MLIRKFKIQESIWKDKRIPKEAKYIYSYIYVKGFERIITDINIGEIQQTIKIKNRGLQKNLEILEQYKYKRYSKIKGLC